MDKIPNQPTYIIGAVARATGIPVETLRVWERRYGVVTPLRDAGNARYYTAEHVERLKLIKALLDQGHAIGSVAKLADPALRKQLALHGDQGALMPSDSAIRVAVCGELLPQMAKAWTLSNTPIELIGSYMGMAEFESAACSASPQILILELPFLLFERLEMLAELVARTAARRGVIVYGFGPETLIESGRKLGLWMIRGPITEQMFKDLCTQNDRTAGPSRGLTADAAEEPPGPRFDSATLARVANVSTSIRCECPHHLADLIFRIHAFERYSADCQNRNEQDAVIHANLRLTAARARVLFEDALANLIAVEGLAERLETEPGSERPTTE